jgi:hypothetical protein
MRVFSATKITDLAVRLNRLYDGGWVVITAHPVFGHGRWIVRIEADSVPENNKVIASGFNLRSVVKDAEKWLKNRQTETVE